MTPASPISKPMASCPAPARLDAYFDHELPQAQHSAVESHLADCTDCRECLARIEAASSLVKSIELPALSQMGQARVMRELTDSAAGRDRWLMPVRLLTTVAAAIFLIATGLIVYQLRHPGAAPGGILQPQPIVQPQPGPGAAPVVPTNSTQR